jgi:cell wall-associated NlpC family hydrolase
MRSFSRNLWCCFSLSVLLTFAACSVAPPRVSKSELVRISPTGAGANDVLFRAISLVGTPYRYGGNTPQGGFDCSGLVSFVFADVAGLQLPRSAQEMSEVGAASIDRNDLVPGDLVFFNGHGRGITHVGIYAGEQRFVHAPNQGGTVRLNDLNEDYWSRHFAGARRIALQRP